MNTPERMKLTCIFHEKEVSDKQQGSRKDPQA